MKYKKGLEKEVNKLEQLLQLKNDEIDVRISQAKRMDERSRAETITHARMNLLIEVLTDKIGELRKQLREVSDDE